MSNTYAQTCVVTATSSSFSTVQCAKGSFTQFSLVTVPRTINDAVESSFVIFAPLIQINWQAKDVPPPPTTSSPGPTNGGSGSGSGSGSGGGGGSGSSPSSTQTSASVANPADKPPAGDSTQTITLSDGAKAGIGLGVGAAVVILAFAAFMLIRAVRRKRAAAAAKRDSRKAGVPLPDQPELGGNEVKELDGTEKPIEKLPFESVPPLVPARSPVELGTGSAAGLRTSMTTDGPVFELEAPDTPITSGRPSFG